MTQKARLPLRLHSGGVYRIRFQGVLDQAWRDRIGEMQVISYANDTEGGAPETLLIGRLADQAALAGMLNLVYSLGLPLLEVVRLGEPLEAGS